MCAGVQFVLLVGCVGLAIYTATQVFGWNGVVLSPTGSNYGKLNACRSHLACRRCLLIHPIMVHCTLAHYACLVYSSVRTACVVLHDLYHCCTS